MPNMPDMHNSTPRTWGRKFGDSFRGLAQGCRDPSFYVHFAMALSVVAVGLALRVSAIEWCLLVLSIAVVLAAELFNTALETLAKAIDQQFNPHLEAGLNMASGAVLLVSLGAAFVGIVVFLGRLGARLAWWQ